MGSKETSTSVDDSHGASTSEKHPSGGVCPDEKDDAGAPTDKTETSISRIPVKKFGGYNLIGRLGFGGMAEVFLAFTSGPGGVRKLVVVKRLHRHLRDAKDFVRMFLDEARLAAQLNHPNIVQTYELGEINGSYFMSMEYLQGQSFDRLLKLPDHGDPVVWNQIVAQVLIDALDGLYFAHQFKDFDGNPLNIIHRDISPQNVFVSYDGIAKILDFGVAKAATQLDSTESGVLKGKCSYVAPEQAYGEKVDQRADLWAMGVVLWEGLVRRRLFKAETNAATLLEVLTAEIPLVMDLSPNIPLTLGQVVEKALQRNPKNRYKSALEMKGDLEQFLKEVPTKISRQQAGDFVSEAFADIRKRQQKVVEECLVDALASRPKAKIKGPMLPGFASSGIHSITAFDPMNPDHRRSPSQRKKKSSHPPKTKSSSPTPTPSPALSTKDRSHRTSGDNHHQPLSHHPHSEEHTSSPEAPLQTYSSVPPPQTTRQRVALIIIAMILAIIATIIVVLIYQRVTARRHAADGTALPSTVVSSAGSLLSTKLQYELKQPAARLDELSLVPDQRCAIEGRDVSSSSRRRGS